MNLYSLLHIMQRQPGWWWWKRQGRAAMQRRRYSLQRVSFGTRKRAEKIFREKRIFVCATNPALPLVHLLREEKTHFLWKFVTCSKILHFLIWSYNTGGLPVGETDFEFCSLYIFMLFDCRKVSNLPFNRVNWPQGDFRNLSHSPNTGFHLWAQLELNQYSTHLDWSD